MARQTKTGETKEVVQSRTCIFCGPTSAKITGEHCWPAWISELFYKKPKPDQYRVIRATNFIRTGDKQQKEYSRASFNERVNVVCKTCNEGWMSDLENDHAKPLIAPMILGRRRLPLSVDDIVVLSAWAMKAAFVFEHTGSAKSGRYYTQSEREQFMRTLVPTDQTEIWLTEYRGQRRASSQVHNLLYELPDPLGPRQGQATTISVGQFAFQVLSGRWPEHIYPRTPLVWDSAVIRIWPTDGTPVRWPPGEYLGDNELEAFAYRWNTKRMNVRRP
jgi:hypothetical protein